MGIIKTEPVSPGNIIRITSAAQSLGLTPVVWAVITLKTTDDTHDLMKELCEELGVKFKTSPEQPRLM